MKIAGACFCGSIKYQATIDENRVGMCHCRDCQIFSGSAFRMSCIADPADFSFTHGEPKQFEKVAASGKKRSMAFCGECGTHLCSLPEEQPDGAGFVSIRLATSEQFSSLRPKFEIFCDSRVAWLTEVEEATQLPGMPTSL